MNGKRNLNDSDIESDDDLLNLSGAESYESDKDLQFEKSPSFQEEEEETTFLRVENSEEVGEIMKASNEEIFPDVESDNMEEIDTDDSSEDDDEEEKAESNEEIEGFSMRNYQKAIYEKMVTKNKNTIIFLETGSGKTIISILIIAHYLEKCTDKKVLFLANTQNLVEQQKLQIQNTLHKLKKSRKFKNDKIIFSIHGEKIRQNKRMRMKEETYKGIKVLIISPQTFLNMLRKNRASLKDFSLLIFDECHHTQGSHPYNQIMQEFYFHNMNSQDKPIVLGLTASPVLAINKTITFEKIKESFENLKKNLDSEFLDLDQAIQNMIPNNQSDAKPSEYENEESIRKSLQDDKDLLEIANTRGFYTFFKDIDIEDLNHLTRLDGVFQLEKEENKIKSNVMAIIYKAGKKLLLENSLIILLQLGKYALYKEIEAFKENLHLIKRDEVYMKLHSQEKELFNLLEKLYDSYLNSIKTWNDKSLTSNKVERLMKILGSAVEASGDSISQKTMIFADTRFIARLLSEKINELGKEMNLKSICITGKVEESQKAGTGEDNQETLTIDEIKPFLESLRADKSKDQIVFHQKEKTKEILAYFSESMMTIDKQMQAVQSFRDGKFNVLVSTSVTEEGFDTPACNVVVAFDEPDSLKSYIQMKGRARQEKSTFYILVHKSKVREWEKRAGEYKGTIEVMKEYAYNPPEKQISQVKENSAPTLAQKKLWLSKKPPTKKKEDENYKWKVTKAGYIINTNWSVELLSYFCSKYRTDELINTKPRYHFIKIPSLGYVCCIILPAIFNSEKLRIVQGGFTHNKSDAKKLAAFKCCENLYEAGYLTDSLKSRLDEMRIYDKLSLGHVFDYHEEKDPVISEKLKKIVVSKIKGAKQKLLYPLTTFNPFKSHYQERSKGIFMGYLYKLEFNKNLSDIKVDCMPNEYNLGFVYFNDKLDNAEIQVDLPKDDQGRLKFKLAEERCCFSCADYERFIQISRFMDATVRSWDVNYFEWLTGQKTNSKNPLYRKRKGLSGIELEDIYNESKKPIFPFYLLLDKQGQIANEVNEKVLKYIEGMKFRYNELSQTVESKEKISIDKTYAEKFKQDPGFCQQQLIQSSMSFNKYLINNYWSIKKKDLDDCKSEAEDLSLHLKIITVLEPNYDYVVGTDDYVLEMKSLGKYSQKLLKGEGHQNAKEIKAFKKSYYGVLGEFIEFPFEVPLLMQLHQFRLSLANLRDHLRVVHFRDEFLVNLERTKSGAAGFTWEYLDLKSFENNMRDVGQLILDTISLKEVSDCSVSEINRMVEDMENLDTEDGKQADTTTSEFLIETKNEANQIFSERIPLDELKLGLSTKEYSNQGNYDRDEMLGDTVLKLLSTIEVFAKFPTHDEFGLHKERTRIINNLNLFRHAVKYDLYEFILKKKKEEQPISYVRNEDLIQKEEQEELSYVADQLKDESERKKKTEESDLQPKDEEKSLKLSSNYEEFHYKTIADVIESLIAVYYNSNGLRAAQKFLYTIEVLSSNSYFYTFKNKPVTKIASIPGMKELKNFVELRLKLKDGQDYKFKDVNLLIQAFCHISIKMKIQALYQGDSIKLSNGDDNETVEEVSKGENVESITQRISKGMKKVSQALSYERLEFLGDAILDYYVVKHFYKVHPEANSGDLTVMKSAVVNNHVLSLICVKNEFDKVLLINDKPGFTESGQRIRENLTTYLNDLDSYYDGTNYEFVKITGDMIEALIGAVYLDSEQDMDMTFEIIDHLCGEMIQKCGDEKHWKNSPEYKVRDYCKKHELPEPKIIKVADDEIEHTSGFGEYVLQSGGECLAKYVAHTTSIHLIQKKLYTEAYKKLKSSKSNKKD